MSESGTIDVTVAQYEIQLEVAGAPGPPGPPGAASTVPGPPGPEGPPGAGIVIKGELSDPSELPPTGDPGDAYLIQGDIWSWGGSAWVNLGPYQGPPGPPGADGPPGEKGDPGDPGAPGADSTVPGPPGDDGASAYQVALDNGFVGTEAEWLASLQGAPGADSTVPGPPGADGQDGASAYGVAVDNGFTGTEQEWLDSLQGEPGPMVSHNSLPDRSEADAHPIGAVTGLQPALDGKLSEVIALTEGDTTPGYVWHVSKSELSPGTDAEPVLFENQDASGLVRTFWLNENMHPRAAAANQEPTIKLFGPKSAGYTGNILEVLTSWYNQTKLFGLNMYGQPCVGPNDVQAGWLIQLGATAPVPPGIPAGTFLLRSDGVGGVPSYVNSSSGTAATVTATPTTVQVPIPAGSQAGDTFLLMVGGNAPTPNFAAASPLVQQINTSYGTSYAMFATRVLDAADVAAGHLDFTYTDGHAFWACATYRNAASFVLGSTWKRAASNTSITAPAVTLTANQMAVVMAWEKSSSKAAGMTVTPTTTERQNRWSNSAGAASVWLGDTDVPGDRTFTTNVASGNGMGLQVALTGGAVGDDNGSLSIWDGATERVLLTGGKDGADGADGNDAFIYVDDRTQIPPGTPIDTLVIERA